MESLKVRQTVRCRLDIFHGTVAQQFFSIGILALPSSAYLLCEQIRFTGLWTSGLFVYRLVMYVLCFFCSNISQWRNRSGAISIGGHILSCLSNPHLLWIYFFYPFLFWFVFFFYFLSVFVCASFAQQALYRYIWIAFLHTNTPSALFIWCQVGRISLKDCWISNRNMNAPEAKMAHISTVMSTLYD